MEKCYELNTKEIIEKMFADTDLSHISYDDGQYFQENKGFKLESSLKHDGTALFTMLVMERLLTPLVNKCFDHNGNFVEEGVTNKIGYSVSSIEVKSVFDMPAQEDFMYIQFKIV